MATDEERLQHLQLPLLLLEWLSGGLANGITSGLLNPMDVAKTRIQEGIRGMWMPGLSASFCREMLSSGPRAGFYVPVRNTIAKVLSSDDAVPSSSSSFIVKILAAITTGTLGSLIANPVDVVKIRLMNDPARYPSLLHALYRLGTEEGVQGLAKGVVPSVLRGAFIAAGELATYDQVKTTVKALFPDQRETATLHVLSSMVTGVVATTVAAPFDLLKTRAMNAVEPKGMLETLKAVVREEGLLVLLRGWLPAYLRLGPHALICFPLFEQIRVAFGLSYL